MLTELTGRDKVLRQSALYNPLGSYQMVIPTGAVTLIAAATASAGQLFIFRWDSATRNAYVHEIGARFICSTAFDTDQMVGCDLILASAFTVDGTNGTAVDCGSTTAATGKLRNSFAKSAIGAGDVRVATTAAITAGTHTLHANPIAQCEAYIAEIGDTVPNRSQAHGVTVDGYVPLYSSEKTGQPLVFHEDSGFVIRNTILMGAAGVGKWLFKVVWDEGTDA